MTIQDIVAGLSQMPQQPQAVNPALNPSAQALRQVPTGPNPTAVAPPAPRGARGMPASPFAGHGAYMPPRHDSSLEGLMEGAPGGSRPNGGLPALISGMGKINPNNGSGELPSADNADEQEG